MFNRKKRRIIPQPSRDFINKDPTSRQERLCALAKHARWVIGLTTPMHCFSVALTRFDCSSQYENTHRDLLKPWAMLPEDKINFNEPYFNKTLRQHEGVGMLLRIGRLDPRGTGSITPEEERGAFVRDIPDDQGIYFHACSPYPSNVAQISCEI